MKKTCSCIISFLNEEERIGNVLKEIVKVKNISQIIAVDGGSTDQGYQFVKKNYPQVELLRMKKNLGKSESVLEGLKKATADYILLYDADLINVNPQEINNVLNKVFNNINIDMVIFRRTVSRLITKLNRMELIYSGERVLKKTDFEEIFKDRPSKFQLEIAINKYMWERKKHVYWVPSSNVNVPKAKKFGILSGWVEDLRMFWQVFSFNPLNYLLHLVFFCRKKLSD